MTPLYVACDTGHNKIVKLLLDHGVHVDISDEVCDISCIHVVKLYNTTKINKATLVTNET